MTDYMNDKRISPGTKDFMLYVKSRHQFMLTDTDMEKDYFNGNRGKMMETLRELERNDYAEWRHGYFLKW